MADGELGSPFCFVYTNDTGETPSLGVQRIRVDAAVTELTENVFSDVTQELWCLEFVHNAMLQTIPQRLFMSCHSLKHVVLPPSLRLIASHAFLDCRNLVSVQIPTEASLERIDVAAFCDCTSLKSIEFPPTLSYIGTCAFYNCQALVFPILPNTIEVIEQECFTACDSFIDVVLPLFLKKVGMEAFSYCTGLKSVFFPCGLEVIERLAFRGCCGLESVHIPRTCTEIGQAAFSGCDALSSIELPVGLTEIHEAMFRRCLSLKIIYIPPTVTILGPGVFEECSALESIELPYGLDSIGGQAFFRCKSLVNIAIPKTVEHMGVRAFDECDLLLKPYSNDEEALIYDLMKRFETLPVHDFCYNRFASRAQPLEQEQITQMEDLEESILHEAAIDPGVDIFGMTPLHIAVLSGRPDYTLCRWLLTKYPSSVATKDAIGGNSPITYACRTNAPLSIVKLLVDTQMTILPSSEIDWKGLIDSAIPSASSDMLKLLVRYSVAISLQCIGLRRWRSNIENAIEGIPEATNGVPRKLQIMLVVVLVGIYTQKERLSLLETALWKMKIDEQKSMIGNHPNVKLTDEMRQDCRISCGGEIIIPMVLSYLRD
eukprot:scaffold991_cov128-Cylindrotheca_fusiformis.AAC.2